ncbi:uncharacterized protein VTP21DRAFT_5412 [Calcarisporiella thermophila]|uniref:uncharacterized protein n=1 Tax=Calcarisporiella thermophila TaxID=911321 RepID=UPI003744218D
MQLTAVIPSQAPKATSRLCSRCNAKLSRLLKHSPVPQPHTLLCSQCRVQWSSFPSPSPSSPVVIHHTLSNSTISFDSPTFTPLLRRDVFLSPPPAMPNMVHLAVTPPLSPCEALSEGLFEDLEDVLVEEEPALPEKGKPIGLGIACKDGGLATPEREYDFESVGLLDNPTNKRRKLSFSELMFGEDAGWITPPVSATWSVMGNEDIEEEEEDDDDDDDEEEEDEAEVEDEDEDEEEEDDIFGTHTLPNAMAASASSNATRAAATSPSGEPPCPMDYSAENRTPESQGEMTDQARSSPPKKKGYTPRKRRLSQLTPAPPPASSASSATSIPDALQSHGETCAPRPTRSPTLFQQLTRSSIDWCRYCGTTEGVNWRPGPWGKRSLCNKHGCDYKGYGFACKFPRLDLRAFEHESVEERERPVLQLYCAECQQTESWKGNVLVRCEGCPKAYHQKCRKGLSDELVQSQDVWFCSDGCKDNLRKKRVVVEYPRKRLPLMNSSKGPASPIPAAATSRSRARAGSGAGRGR